jgi:ABC-type branched-subunit amino acid transport system ATPase component
MDDHRDLRPQPGSTDHELSGATPVLHVSGLVSGYGHAPVLRDVALSVAAGEVLAVIGPNGAGKTTLLRTLAGVIKPMAGQMVVNGHDGHASLHVRARRGLAYVSEGRSVIRQLTVAENLRVARCAVDEVVDLFPELEPLLDRTVGLLSGGEQQMLALARGLGRHPVVLLADELSLGLGPLIVDRLIATVQTAVRDGLAAVIVEQHLDKVLQVANRVVVITQGAVALDLSAQEARGRLDELEALYLSSKVA